MHGRCAIQSVTGDAYDAQLALRASDRAARAAFRQLALALAPAGGRIFDFGAGTGLDAVWYAQHGLEVRAFEPDPSMCAAFEARCRPWLEGGRVSLEQGAYGEFLARCPAAAGADVVTANFAPLNLIPELPGLFAHLHARCAPGGSVLASVLNPWYPGDLQYAWWWRRLPQLVGTGRCEVAGACGPIVRRTLSTYARECRPYFVLCAAFPGRLGRASLKQEMTSPPRGSALMRLITRYTFLLFARRDGIPAHEDPTLI